MKLTMRERELYQKMFTEGLVRYCTFLGNVNDAGDGIKIKDMKTGKSYIVSMQRSE